jgi:Protein of unknown function (DUF3710)
VGIFRRGTKDTRADHSSAAATDDEDLAASDSGADHDPSGDGDSALVATPSAPAFSRSGGPFDRSEVEGLEGRLDLGALWLTGLPGMELRVEVEEESESLVGVTAVLGESAVQMQAFAAPRTEGIWDEIRTEIAASITSQGGTADKRSGPLGAELRAQMPGQGPDGRVVFSPARFVGVDGPRWFLRAVISGPAALDEDAASDLLDVVRATVVVRGDEAMAPRELLQLKLPVATGPGDEGMADQEMADADLADADATDAETTERDLAGRRGGRADKDAKAPPSLDDLKPFERGPEITEIH